MKKLILSLVFFLNLYFVNAQIWSAPSGIREIPVPGLPDIACASYDQFGPVIYFNPQLCAQAGPLVTAFCQAHEYGHHFLNHLIKKATPNPYLQLWVTLYAENEADAFATEYWIRQNNRSVIQAIYIAMWDKADPGDATHAPSRQRATNIATLYYQLTGYNLFP